MKKISDKQLRNIIREAIEEYSTGAGYSIKQANGQDSAYKFHAAPNSFGDENLRMNPGGAGRSFGRQVNMDKMRGKGNNRQATGADDFNVRDDVNYGKGWTSKAVKRSKNGKDFYAEIRDLVDDISKSMYNGQFGKDPLVLRVVSAYNNSMMGLANQYLRQVRGYNMRANKASQTQAQGQISIPSNGGQGSVPNTATPVKPAMEEAYNPNSVYGLQVSEGWITRIVNKIQSLINDGIIGDYSNAGSEDIEAGKAAADGTVSSDGLVKRKNEAGLMTKDFLELLRLAKMSTVVSDEQLEKMLPAVPQQGEQGGNLPVAVGGGQGGNLPVAVGGGQGDGVDDQGYGIVGGNTEKIPEPTPEQEDEAFKDKGKIRKILKRFALLAAPLLLAFLGAKGCQHLAQGSEVPVKGNGNEIVAPAPVSQEQNTKCTCDVGSPQINEAQQLTQFAQSLQKGTQVTILVWGNNAAGTNWNSAKQQKLDQQRMQNTINIIQQANPEVKIVKQNYGDWTKNAGTPNITISTVSSSTYAMERKKSNKPVISESELKEMICNCIKKSLKIR